VLGVGMKKLIWYSLVLLWIVYIFSARTAVAITSDDFNSPTLNNTTWSIINPKLDATFAMVNTHSPNASLGISIPGGTSHDVYIGNWAPRIMQTAENTDFEVEVKFQSLLNKDIQMQGIIIEQDKDNFLRFDFYSLNPQIWILAANINVGSFSIISNNPIGAVSNSAIPLYMRVKRVGDSWTQNYSFDGITWITSASFNRALTVTSVGPFAGNAGGNPAFTGLIDYFFNTSSPVIPEDE
jgi:hypothetical protein